MGRRPTDRRHRRTGARPDRRPCRRRGRDHPAPLGVRRAHRAAAPGGACIAEQVTSLQHLSGDRVILGVGAGGDRHERSWAAAGVPRRERGRRTDTALAVWPDLLSGQPTTLGQLPDSPTIQLAPSVTVPPIVVGGMSELAAAGGRPTPALTASMMTAISDDGALPPHDALVRRLTDVNGMYGSPTDQVATLLTTGGPTEIAARLAEYSDIGAERVVVTLAAGDWYRQAELVAEARASLD